MEKKKQEAKLSFFADDMILHIENLTNATRKLLELINEFGKVVGYKINTQEYFSGIYTNNKILERVIEKTILFNISYKQN